MKKIAVVMSTYNGGRYLREQIDSILSQFNVEVELYIRDDGSKDETKEILSEYSTNHENIHVVYGDNVGYARSFLYMLREVKDCDYFAFSDQDDMWLPQKLYSACSLLKDYEGERIPVLYYSNLLVSDSQLNVKHATKLQERKKNLKSTFLRRSIAGNTMVFNSALKDEIFRGELSDGMLRLGHDSFIISLCYALDGVVICDENAYIKYRQHVDNTAGAPLSIKTRIKKEYRSMKKERGYEAGLAKEILRVWGDKLSDEKKEVLQLVASLDTSLWARIKVFVSPSFSTGNPLLTLVAKLKILFTGA